MRVKICGIRTIEDAVFSASTGASYIGLVFYPKSPRNVEHNMAREIALALPAGVAKVALIVDASDDEIKHITDNVPLDFLQLHGSESPERTNEIRAKFGLPIIKALGISSKEDIKALADYTPFVDQFLLDAKAQNASELPGGNGHAFDWSILHEAKITKPWLLAGGLTPMNVKAAIKETRALQVDVSSGVESARGIKDKDLIKAFIDNARSANERVK